MARTVSIGNQDFQSIIENNGFYVDKTGFISDWWNQLDVVTLITRPRRFGKTLNLSMLERFFSNKYAGNASCFEGLAISKDEKVFSQQGMWPVIFISFANIKQTNYEDMLKAIRQTFSNVLWETIPGELSDTLAADAKSAYKALFDNISDADPSTIPDSNVLSSFLGQLSSIMNSIYDKEVIILMDEYDTPMQEAYINGFWDEALAFFRTLFNSTFKTNSYLNRAVITGITRISKESLFSDLNNLRIDSTASPVYETAFGFTEQEVFDGMSEMGLEDREHVKKCYDGFVFGKSVDIYNPWSITNYLKTGKLEPYWMNTSGHGLLSKLIREGSASLKDDFGVLLEGGTIGTPINKEVVFSDLDGDTEAIWGLMVASGYLKIVDTISDPDSDDPEYCTLQITNGETRRELRTLVKRWFSGKGISGYSEFVNGFLKNDIDAMNYYMQNLVETSMSYFDTAGNPNDTPENFYHGFVLALLVELSSKYELRSNRESGLGRYDIMLRPRDVKADDGYIIEFKVRHSEKGEKSLEDTVAKALAQIEDKNYAAELRDMGLPEERIHRYGFAFEGKKVLIEGKLRY